MIVDLGGSTYTVPPFSLMPHVPVEHGMQAQAHLAVGLSYPEFSEFKAIHLRQVNKMLHHVFGNTRTPAMNRAQRRKQRRNKK